MRAVAVQSQEASDAARLLYRLIPDLDACSIPLGALMVVAVAIAITQTGWMRRLACYIAIPAATMLALICVAHGWSCVIKVFWPNTYFTVSC